MAAADSWSSTRAKPADFTAQRIQPALPRPSTPAREGFSLYPLPLNPSLFMLSPMRILVVEDDKKIASFVVNGLKQSGFAVDHAMDGEDGLVRAQTIAYDAAVVDVMLPKLDGLSLVKKLRASAKSTPVL